MAILHKLLLEADKKIRVLVCAPTSVACLQIAKMFMTVFSKKFTNLHQVLLFIAEGDGSKLLDKELESVHIESRLKRLAQVAKVIPLRKAALLNEIHYIQALNLHNVENPSAILEQFLGSCRSLVTHLEDVKMELGQELMDIAALDILKNILRNCLRTDIPYLQKVKDLQSMLLDENLRFILAAGVEGMDTGILTSFTKKDALLNHCQVVFTNVFARSIFNRLEPFDLVIVDEAYQVCMYLFLGR